MTSLPAQLLGILEHIPEDHQSKIISGWEKGRSIVSFRVNHLKSSREEVLKALDESGLPYQEYTFQNQETPLNPPLSGGQGTDAFYLDKVHEYALRGLEIYTTGKIYVQSLSSMIPALCLNLEPGQKILDMAAAPGSKTTQIASILRGNCHITALEKFGVRLEKLVHTIKTQGAENCVEVIKTDASNISFLKEMPTKEAEDLSKNKSPNGVIMSPPPFKKGVYDRILLDVPCSSDGRINLEDEKTYCWYSGDKSRSKSLLQYEMLEQARKMLVDGGKIVYSTCSISRRENEDVVQKFLKTHPEFQLLPCPVTSDYTLEKDMNRWYPNAMMEGFFVAILEKKN